MLFDANLVLANITLATLNLSLKTDKVIEKLEFPFSKGSHYHCKIIIQRCVFYIVSHNTSNIIEIIAFNTKIMLIRDLDVLFASRKYENKNVGYV